MVIEVTKIFEDFRHEGIGTGLPMTHVQMGPGGIYERIDDLVKDIYVLTSCKWVYIFGSNTTVVGMGSVIKILSQAKRSLEIQCPSTARDPGWFSTVDRWIVDVVPRKEIVFNFGALRRQDAIRFAVNSSEGLQSVRGYLSSMDFKIFQGVKIVSVVGSSDTLYKEALDLFKTTDEVRVYFYE